MGAAVVPAALADCAPASAKRLQTEIQAGAHCPMAEMAARSLECCLPGSPPGGEEAGAPTGPSLPDCCLSAPEEPAELPRGAVLHGETAHGAEPPERAAEELPVVAESVSLPVDPALTAPPADLCILHAAFLN
jgi:hypothetical protein